MSRLDLLGRLVICSKNTRQKFQLECTLLAFCPTYANVDVGSCLQDVLICVSSDGFGGPLNFVNLCELDFQNALICHLARVWVPMFISIALLSRYLGFFHCVFTCSLALLSAVHGFFQQQSRGFGFFWWPHVLDRLFSKWHGVAEGLGRDMFFLHLFQPYFCILDVLETRASYAGGSGVSINTLRFNSDYSLAAKNTAIGKDGIGPNFLKF